MIGENEEDEVVIIVEVELDEDEKAVLKRRPEFALYERLDEKEMRIEIEKGMAKVRWDSEKNGYKEIREERKEEDIELEETVEMQVRIH